MKRRLFLTGPIGCGKSTAIANALGDRMAQCGGFLTRRHREPHLHFTLESPDGAVTETFLDFPFGKPVPDLEVFTKLGTQLLIPEEISTPVSEPARNDRVFILDEIGGIELLNPVFAAALESVLCSDIPILGVIKGPGPAGALVEALGLADEYTCAFNGLWKQLLDNPDSLVYECAQYDKNALLLAKQWVEEFLP